MFSGKITELHPVQALELHPVRAPGSLLELPDN